MPVLEIITIGTELLLGEIQDTNSTYIARTLRDHGIDIYRITTIGDNAVRIAGAIQEAAQRADIIITTGGLGPTIDDPTRQAVARAVQRELIFLPELWEDIVERFKAFGHIPTENNKRQAFIPKDALPIRNPVGTAPCFIAEAHGAYIISLPGVPREMEFLLHQSIIPFLSQKFALENQIIKAVVLHTASMGESAIDEIIGDLEELSNPTVGLLAHPGQVDIRVTAKAASEKEAMILNDPVIKDLENRLGSHIYGRDGETLEIVIADHLRARKLKLGIVEQGLDGHLTSRLENHVTEGFQHHDLISHPENLESFKDLVMKAHTQGACDVSLGVSLFQKQASIEMLMVTINPEGKIKTKQRTYGGPPGNAPLWSENAGLDLLRRILENQSKLN
jgi:competence/damage-inducible protein CinA-like protein